jgi:DnaJ-class molecular chaperone
MAKREYTVAWTEQCDQCKGTGLIEDLQIRKKMQEVLKAGSGLMPDQKDLYYKCVKCNGNGQFGGSTPLQFAINDLITQNQINVPKAMPEKIEVPVAPSRATLVDALRDIFADIRKGYTETFTCLSCKQAFSLEPVKFGSDIFCSEYCKNQHIPF